MASKIRNQDLKIGLTLYYITLCLIGYIIIKSKSAHLNLPSSNLSCVFWGKKKTKTVFMSYSFYHMATSPRLEKIPIKVTTESSSSWIQVAHCPVSYPSGLPPLGSLVYKSPQHSKWSPISTKNYSLYTMVFSWTLGTPTCYNSSSFL